MLFDYVQEEGQKVLTLVYKIRCSGNYTKKEEKQLSELIEYVEENLPVFNFGYFNLGKPTILRIFATVANFLIVVVQLTNKV